MYATIFQCDMHGIASPQARGQAGRTLATLLGALPGFVAFVALDGEKEVGALAALCIVDNATSLAEVRRVMAHWQVETCGGSGAKLAEINAGAVVAQRGL